MNFRYLFFSLLFSLFGLMACNNESTDQTKEAENNTDTTAQTTTTEEPSQPQAPQLVIHDAVASLEAGGEADKSGLYWGVPVEITLPEGYMIAIAKADMGGNDWLFEGYQLQKDGEGIYDFPHKDGYMGAATVRNDVERRWLPKVVTKGDQTMILMVRYMGEVNPEGAHLIDAIKIENGNFVEYVENVNNNYVDELSEDEIKAIFEKVFG